MSITDEIIEGLRSDNLPREIFGGFNDMPPNWEEITESEFLWRFSNVVVCRKMFFRQVKLPSVKHGGTRADIGTRELFCTVYFWVNTDGSGVGFIKQYNGKATRSEIDAYFAQWFKFKICDHEYETVVSRMCYWEGKCKKCGYVSVVDSSD